MVTPGTRVPMTSVDRDKLVSYIDEELEEALIEHEDRVQRLNEMDRFYMAEPAIMKRMFPWPGACNIEIPIIAQTVDSIVARMTNTVFSMEPFWTLRPLHKDVEEIYKPLENHLDWSRQVEFNLYRTVRSSNNELVKYGWSWYKVCWETYTKPRMTTGAGGFAVRDDIIIRRPNVYHVLNRDVVTQAGVEDWEQAEWTAHNIRLTDNQMLLRKYDKVYDNVDEVLKAKDDIQEIHDSLKDSPRQGTGRKEKLNSLYEIWLEWPYGPDRVPIGMTVVYHRPTRKLLRCVFQPYPFCPLRKTHFILREGRMEGLGIARRLMPLQEEISTIHRQQIDNSTLANTRFFVGRRNVVRPGTQIWPGRVLPVGDPKNDLVAMQLGDIYQSQGVLETRALSYAERASGVSDYQLGRESSVAGSRATATGTLAVIQEGNRRFDLNIRDSRDCLSGIGRDILVLNQMFRPKGLAYFVQGEDGKWTDEALSLPPDFEVGKMAVELTASTASINKASEKQELMQLAGITRQYYMDLTQAAMIMANPQVPPEVKQIIMGEVRGGQLLMKKIVQAFDVKSVDILVPGLIQEQQAELGGTAGNPAGDQANGRLAALSQLYAAGLRNGDVGSGGEQGLQRIPGGEGSGEGY